MKFDIRLRYAIGIILFIFFVIYFLYQARALLYGPQIQIENLKDGQVVADPLVIIEGQSKNIAWVSLNDRQIFTDEDGKWSEKLLVSPGLSIMTIKARDRFGHEIRKNVRIVLPAQTGLNN
ncbi:MAG: hypothetical protein AAB586_00325 [Patescibacteria group bacterium]